MRCAVINKETNIVENVIVLSESSLWAAPENFYLVVSPEAGIGFIYDKVTSQFTNPNPLPEEISEGA